MGKTGNRESAIGNREQAGNRESAIGNRGPEAGDRQAASGKLGPEAGHRESAIGNRGEDADIALRPAVSGDLEAVRALLVEARLPVDGLEEQFGERYAVAESGGRIIGAEGIEVYQRWGLLRSAVVAPGHRGTGLGVRLTENRSAWARDQHLEALYLLTTTAAPFFTRIGFVTVPRDSAPAAVLASREFAGVCPSSAVCMRLELGTA